MALAPKFPQPPTNYYIGKIDGQWPVYLFETKDSAIKWYEDRSVSLGSHEAHRIHLWHIKNCEYDYVTYVPPTNPDLKAVER